MDTKSITDFDEILRRSKRKIFYFTALGALHLALVIVGRCNQNVVGCQALTLNDLDGRNWKHKSFLGPMMIRMDLSFCRHFQNFDTQTKCKLQMLASVDLH